MTCTANSIHGDFWDAAKTRSGFMIQVQLGSVLVAHVDIKDHTEVLELCLCPRTVLGWAHTNLSGLHCYIGDHGAIQAWIEAKGHV